MLFLFDIDGTLLRRLPPAHREAICAACLEVLDQRVAPDGLGRTAGMPSHVIEASLPALYDAAAAAYDRLVDDDLRAYHTPYAAEALAWLADRGATLGLVTGNIQRIAWRKLSAAGLAEPFRFGAFGDESAAREALPPLALLRARDLFARSFSPDDVYVVGDTPADLACGMASGLRTIGVATGPERTLEELRACGPDYLIADLRELERLGI